MQYNYNYNLQVQFGFISMTMMMKMLMEMFNAQQLMVRNIKIHETIQSLDFVEIDFFISFVYFILENNKNYHIFSIIFLSFFLIKCAVVCWDKKLKDVLYVRPIYCLWIFHNLRTLYHI